MISVKYTRKVSKTGTGAAQIALGKEAFEAAGRPEKCKIVVREDNVIELHPIKEDIVAKI